ncbi:MAG: hypothetical protein GX753_01775 [Erysipelothrix sp.]|nr:hypothetical protein [Erysipelothrix sp.]
MKRIIPLAILASAVGAAAVYMRNNKKAVDRTLEALDELSETAEETVEELSEAILDGTEE